MEVFLVDGTYELFRHYYALPSARDKQGREVGAVRGVLASVLGMIEGPRVPRPCLAVCARQGGDFDVDLTERKSKSPPCPKNRDKGGAPLFLK